MRNLEFASVLEPANRAIRDKLAWACSVRGDGRPTAPTTLGSERVTNPYLRLSSPELLSAVRERVPCKEEGVAELFSAIRRLEGEL